jgi:dihydropteroate synthase
MYTLNCKGKLLVIDQPLVMGIINTTPDSFFAGSRQPAVDEVVEKASAMLAQGAAILDIGGQSTRPDAEIVGAEEEAGRVVPAIQAICSHFPEAIVSVDTFHAAVAEAAVKAGAAIVNDVSAGLYDAAMLSTVAALRVPYILMHHKGIPASAKVPYRYANLTKDVIDFFIGRLLACRSAGIKDIVIDPGFGFGKNAAQNLLLLRGLASLKIFDLPILAGLSRKSTIYKTLGITADQALNGTTVLNTIALLNGASILRVHDVKEAAEAVTLVGAYCKNL